MVAWRAARLDVHWADSKVASMAAYSVEEKAVCLAEMTAELKAECSAVR